MTEHQLWDTAPRTIAGRCQPGDTVCERGCPAWAGELLRQELAALGLALVLLGKRRVVLPADLATDAKLLAALARDPEAPLTDLLEEHGRCDAAGLADRLRKALEKRVASRRRQSRPRGSGDVRRLGPLQEQVLRAALIAGACPSDAAPMGYVLRHIDGGQPRTKAQTAALSRAIRQLERRGLIWSETSGTGRYTRGVALTTHGRRVAEALFTPPRG